MENNAKLQHLSYLGDLEAWNYIVSFSSFHLSLYKAKGGTKRSHAKQWSDHNTQPRLQQ